MSHLNHNGMLHGVGGPASPGQVIKVFKSGSEGKIELHTQDSLLSLPVDRRHDLPTIGTENKMDDHFIYCSSLYYNNLPILCHNTL